MTAVRAPLGRGGREKPGRREELSLRPFLVSRWQKGLELARAAGLRCEMSELRAAGPGPGTTPVGASGPVASGQGGTSAPAPVTPLPSPGPGGGGGGGRGDGGGGTLGPGGPAPGGVATAPGGSSASASGSATSTSGAAREGWLFKWTNYIKGYQRRWFVLSNGLLSYYR